MSNLNYLAYGSNLHPMRLMERVPSASFVGSVEIPGFQLTFHKRSNDGSAKCNLLSPGADGASAFCAIYSIDSNDKPALDKAEGKGFGYLETQITVPLNNVQCLCFTYLAQQSHIAGDLKPFHWYKEMVILGAQHLKFPSEYIESIEAFESQHDPDSARREKNEALLKKMREFR